MIKCRFWHPGHVDDATEVLDFIHKEYPNAKVYLVGFSAGSNIVHKLIVKNENQRGFIRGAVCICVNGDYLSSRKKLESTLQGKVYSALITLGYKVIKFLHE